MNDLLARCLHLLQQQHIEGYLVGGIVRDNLLERPNDDIDLAVTADALKVARSLADQLGGAYYALDTKRETGRVVMPDRSVIDVALIRGGNIYNDLAARDFTINALARPLEELNTLIDPHHGAADLQTHTLRAVSEQSFSADPIRVLRAVRQAVELGFEIAPQTLDLMQRDAPMLAQVSGERVRDELVKLLQTGNGPNYFKLLEDFQLLRLVLPHACWNAEQKFQTDQLALLAAMLTGGSFSEAELRLTVQKSFLSLLADYVGHMLSDDRTRLSMLPLAVLYDEWVDAETDLRRLKFSRVEIEFTCALIQQRFAFARLTAPLDALAIHRFFRDTQRVGLGLIYLALSRVMGQPNQAATLSLASTLLQSYVEAYDRVIAPKPLLNGAELAEQFGLRGPQIGQWLEKLIEAQVSGTVRTRADAELFLRNALNSEPEA